MLSFAIVIFIASLVFLAFPETRPMAFINLFVFLVHFPTAVLIGIITLFVLAYISKE